MFDLNSLLRNGDKWNPTNAYKLMEYTVKKGYPIAGWELGNGKNPDKLGIPKMIFTIFTLNIGAF